MRDRIGLLLALTADLFWVSVPALLSRERTKTLARARHAAMSTLYAQGLPQRRIGDVFQRDTSTVSYGVKTARSLARRDPGYAEKLERLRRSALQIFAGPAHRGAVRYVSPRVRTLNAKERSNRETAYSLKTAEPDAVKKATAAMKGKVKRGSALIPIPDSTGSTAANLLLAQSLARATNSQVLDSLRRTRWTPSNRQRHMSGDAPLTVEEHFMVWRGPPLAGREVLFIDNVITTGSTFDAARAAVGTGHGLAFADARGSWNGARGRRSVIKIKPVMVPVWRLEMTERVRDDWNVEAIAELFRVTEGWPPALPPVFILDSGEIIDGHHRVLGAQMAGRGEVLAVEVDAGEYQDLLWEKGYDRDDAFEELSGWEYPMSYRFSGNDPGDRRGRANRSLRSRAGQVRKEAEGIWREIGPKARHPDYRTKKKTAAGRCYQTALWMRDKFKGHGRAVLVQGAEGSCKKHYWLRVGGVDVDITGDQYGHPKIQVGELPYQGKTRSWPKSRAPGGHPGAMIRAQGHRAKVTRAGRSSVFWHGTTAREAEKLRRSPVARGLHLAQDRSRAEEYAFLRAAEEGTPALLKIRASNVAPDPWAIQELSDAGLEGHAGQWVTEGPIEVLEALVWDWNEEAWERSAMMRAQGHRAKVTRDGPLIRLYHRTTPATAAALARGASWRSDYAGREVWFSNRPDGHATDYGTKVVVVEVPERYAQLDDEFPDGEQHFTVTVADLARHSQIVRGGKGQRFILLELLLAGRIGHLERRMQKLEGRRNLHPAARTAITRQGASAPLKKLWSQGKIQGSVLDFGAGRGGDASWLRRKGQQVAAYDPHHGPTKLPRRQFDTVLCTYVLNVIPPKEQKHVLRELRSLIKPGGAAYVTVRTDTCPAPLAGVQECVKMGAPVAASGNGFRTYKVIG